MQRYILACIFKSFQAKNCFPNDHKIPIETPVTDVFVVVLHPFFDLPELFGLATKAIYLGPAGEAGFYVMAHEVVVHFAAEEFGMGQHMGPGSHHAHIAPQHVHELGQLVEVGAAQEATDGRNTRIVFRSLAFMRFAVEAHAPEFIALKGAVVDARAGLYKQYRSARVQLNDQGDNWIEPREDKNDHKTREGDVEKTFLDLIFGQIEGDALRVVDNVAVNLVELNVVGFLGLHRGHVVEPHPPAVAVEEQFAQVPASGLLVVDAVHRNKHHLQAFVQHPFAQFVVGGLAIGGFVGGIRAHVAEIKRRVEVDNIAHRAHHFVFAQQKHFSHAVRITDALLHHTVVEVIEREFRDQKKKCGANNQGIGGAAELVIEEEEEGSEEEKESAGTPEHPHEAGSETFFGVDNMFTDDEVGSDAGYVEGQEREEQVRVAKGIRLKYAEVEQQKYAVQQQ